MSLGAGSATRTELTKGVDDRYDLDLDKRLSEETTVLVENYTVRYGALEKIPLALISLEQSCPTDA